MKKWFAFILFIITAAGTFIPCCQEDDCCENIPVSSTDKKTSNEGICSPFFSCTACQGFVELAKPILFVQPYKIKQLHSERPQPVDLAAFSSSFWQPPRYC